MHAYESNQSQYDYAHMLPSDIHHHTLASVQDGLILEYTNTTETKYGLEKLISLRIHEQNKLIISFKVSDRNNSLKPAITLQLYIKAINPNDREQR